MKLCPQIVVLSLVLSLSPLGLADDKKPDVAEQISNSKNNLKQLGLGMILWRDMQGKAVNFPPLDRMLSTLWNDNVTQEIELFRCPGWKTKVTAEDLKNNRIEKLGYVATPWGAYTHRGSSETPMVWTRPGLYPEDGRLVLFYDGHVEMIQAKRFEKLIETTAKAAVEHLKAGRVAMHVGAGEAEASPKERDAALRKMAKAPDEKQTKLLAELVAGLNDKHYKVREQASKELRGLGVVAIGTLMALRSPDTSTLQQRTAANTLLEGLYDGTLIERRLEALRKRVARVMGKPRVEAEK